MRIVLFAAVAVLCATAAVAAPVNLVSASEGYTYFNQPGADMAAHDRALAGCGREGLRAAVAGPGQQVARLHSNIENCMVVRGWRVIRMPDTEGARLIALGRDALHEALVPWVGADQPHGEVVRSWGNDAFRPDTIVNPSLTVLQSALKVHANRSLSVAVMVVDTSGPKVRSGYGPYSRPRFAPPVRADSLEALPPGMAVVILTLKGKLPGPPAFLRPAAIRDDKAARKDKLPYMFFAQPYAMTGKLVGAADDKTFAFIIAPGLWRLDGVGTLTTFCLGAPSFEVKAGEVLYLGELDLGAETPTVATSPEPAIAFLQSAPTALSRLQLASWTNGNTDICQFGHSYAFEFANLPFADGYTRAEAGIVMEEGGRPQ